MTDISQKQGGWTPIETAPEDQEVLVLRRDGIMHVAKVGGFGGRKYGILSADFGNASCHFFFPVGGNYAEDDDTPTHWMPLPKPPRANPSTDQGEG